MVEPVLNLANIAACVVAAAGSTVAGDAASLTSGALDSADLWRSLTAENPSAGNRSRP